MTAAVSAHRITGSSQSEGHEPWLAIGLDARSALPRLSIDDPDDLNARQELDPTKVGGGEVAAAGSTGTIEVTVEQSAD